MSCAYICKKCGGKVVQEVLRHEPGLHEVSWRCTYAPCMQCYGVPWREGDYEYPLARTLDAGLDPWPVESETYDQPVPLAELAALEQRRPTMDDVRRFASVVMRGATIGTVSAISTLVILWLLFMGQ